MVHRHRPLNQHTAQESAPLELACAVCKAREMGRCGEMWGEIELACAVGARDGEIRGDVRLCKVEHPRAAL